MMNKRLVQTLLLLFIICLPLLSQAQPSKVDQYISAGQEYHRNGMLKEAVKEFRKALNTDTKNGAAGIGLGNAAMQLQDWNNAKRGFEVAHSATPGDCAVSKSLAYVYLRLKLRDRSKKIYVEVIGKSGRPGCDPGDNFSKTNLATLLSSSKGDTDLAWAIQLLNQVINNESEDLGLLARSHYLLGNLYKKKKNYDLAIQNMEKSFELQPEKLDGRYSIGLLYFNKQKYDKALEHLKIAYDKRENDFKINLMMGLCYNEMNRHEEDAIFHFTRAVNLYNALQPEKKAREKNLPHRYLANLLNDTGDFKKAIEVANEGIKAAKKASEKAGLICSKAKAFEKKGNYEKALDLFEMVEDDPTWGDYALKQIERQEMLIDRQKAQDLNR